MPWTFKCLDCNQDIVEYRRDGTGYDIKVGICLDCTAKAVEQMEGNVMTICEPCLERTRKAIPATHFAGKTPMCKDCFRGVDPSEGKVPVGVSWRFVVEACAKLKFNETYRLQDKELQGARTLDQFSKNVGATLYQYRETAKTRFSFQVDGDAIKITKIGLFESLADEKPYTPEEQEAVVHSGWHGCACGCGKKVPANRIYFRGHKSSNAKVIRVETTAMVHQEEEKHEITLHPEPFDMQPANGNGHQRYPIQMSEELMDQVWMVLTAAKKAELLGRL